MKRIFCLAFVLVLTLSMVGCKPAEPARAGWYDENTISITAQQVDSIVNGEFEKPKNVILLIGDGMGPNDITLCEQYGVENFEFGLVLNRIPNHGLCTTHSADNEVTDSAASATALATGVKTNNGYLGMLPDGTHLKNISEIAREHGKKIGIVTDDEITGATPSGFLVHNENRKNYDDIYTSALDFAPDVYIGKADTGYHRQATKLGYTAFLPFQTIEGEIDKTKPFVAFNCGSSQLAGDELFQCTQLALNLLDNENGFFLMVESCGTDKYGHDNVMKGKISSVTTLDRTLAAILLFMQENPDTLLIVTSDHETGGVQLPLEGEPVDNKLFTTSEHTGIPVRVFAVGQGSEYFAGKTVDNTDIGKFLIEVIEGE